MPPLLTRAGALACWRARIRLEREQKSHSPPLDRLFLPTPACWMSLTSNGALQEGDSDTDLFLDLLLLLLTKQLTSGIPIDSNFLKVGKTSGRGDALTSMTNSPESPRAIGWLNAPNTFLALIWGLTGLVFSTLHTTDSSKFCIIIYIFLRRKNRQKLFLAIDILAV